MVSRDAGGLRRSCVTHGRVVYDLGRVASVDGEVTADNSIVTAATKDGACPTRTTAGRTSVATDLHCPIAAATGRNRRGNGLASAEHHVRAVWRRLHPHSSRTHLGLASHRHILGNGAGRPTALHETSVIETVCDEPCHSRAVERARGVRRSRRSMRPRKTPSRTEWRVIGVRSSNYLWNLLACRSKCTQV